MASGAKKIAMCAHDTGEEQEKREETREMRRKEFSPSLSSLLAPSQYLCTALHFLTYSKVVMHSRSLQ